MRRTNPPATHMQYRVGKCGSCGATFKVPASFKGDKAKCKACETGVVEIGPVQGADEPAEPKPAPETAPAADEPMEEYTPSGKKRSGPSMMEQLRAQRGGEEAPKPVPARKPGAAKKTAGTAKPAATRSGSTKAGAAKTSRPSSARSGAAKKTTRKAGARAGAGSRRRGGDDDEDGGSRRGRRQPAKKKSPMPLIAGLLVLAGVAFGVISMMGSDNTEVQANDEQVATGTENTTDQSDATAADENGSQDAEATDTGGAVDSGETGDDPQPEETAPAEEPVTPTEPDTGPDLTDTEAFPRFGAPAGVSEDDWAAVQKDVDLIIDPLAGAKGNRALKRVVESSKPGFAAIVNRMLDLDYSTEQGYRDGDVLQRGLEQIANGKNAGWKYSIDPADVKFNRKVVALLYKVWNRAKDDEAYWLNYTKQDKAADESEGEILSDDDLDDLDDLDF